MSKERRTPELQDLVAFMKMMDLSTMTTQKDLHGYRFYMTIEPVPEEEIEEDES